MGFDPWTDDPEGHLVWVYWEEASFASQAHILLLIVRLDYANEGKISETLALRHRSLSLSRPEEDAYGT